MSPQRPAQEHPAVAGLDALPLRHILLAVGILAAVGILMATVAMAYQPSRIKARSNSEAVFLNAASSHLRSVFADGNYRGVDVVWSQAQAQQEGWVQSPNQVAWQAIPVALNGTFPVACNPGARCPAVAFQYNYFQTLEMDPKECQQLLLALTHDFEVQAMRLGGMTDDIAHALCDRSSPSAPPLLYIVAR